MQLKPAHDKIVFDIQANTLTKADTERTQIGARYQSERAEVDARLLQNCVGLREFKLKPTHGICQFYM